MTFLFDKAGAVSTTYWRPGPSDDLFAPSFALPVIEPQDIRPILPGMDVWDDRCWWFFLAAPRFADPDERHDHARIHLLSTGAGGWRDHGVVLPDGFSAGTREWSGSAVMREGGEVTLFFTAAGRREGGPRFEQRLFETKARIDASEPTARLGRWNAPEQLFEPDGEIYARADEDEAIDGMIRGFRDPGFFRDPADGSEYVLFTGTAGRATSKFDGLIGIAQRDGAHWRALPPLIDAAGVNKELERPHVICAGGLYYLFWSTHSKRFAPGIAAPTGLYGMVAENILGPWRPLNGSGLVAANPTTEPLQAYCWWVTGELEVASFIDQWGLQGRSLSDHPDLRRTHFGGTIAPFFRLDLRGDTTTIVQSDER
jgi:levansucrase